MQMKIIVYHYFRGVGGLPVTVYEKTYDSLNEEDYFPIHEIDVVPFNYL